MVGRVLAKDEVGVRFSLSAQRVREIFEKACFLRIFPSEHADIRNIRTASRALIKDISVDKTGEMCIKDIL